MKKVLMLLGACLGLQASGAFADGDSPWYLGASIGEARGQHPQEERDFLGYTQPTIDNRDTGGKLYGGYRFRPNWAVEFGYATLGKNNLKETAFAADSFRTDGLFVALRGSYPVNDNWSVLGELGVVASRTRYRCEFNCVGLQETTAHGTSALLGVGVEYNVNKNLSVRAEYELYNRLKGSIRGATTQDFHADHDLTSVGVVYRFN